MPKHHHKHQQKRHHHRPPRCSELKALKLQQDRLWGDHFWETRAVVIDAATGNPCLTVDLKTLYENQANLGANFAALTGKKRAGEKLAAALTQHITIAVEIVLAAIANQSIDALYKQWQENAEVVAGIYHHYHHPIKFRKINQFMQGHLETTLNEAVAIIKGDCVASDAAGKIALEHIRMMADYLNSKFHC
jgi:hypothetical protein